MSAVEIRNAGYGETIEFIGVLLSGPISKYECIIWPFSIGSHGYGSVKSKLTGKITTSHRAVFQDYTGEKLTSNIVVRHKCRDRRCVNPFHLESGTHADNVKDKLRDGTLLFGENAGTSKLTDEKVLSIYNMVKNGEPIEDVAKAFGVTYGTVNPIVSGKTWKHLNLDPLGNMHCRKWQACVVDGIEYANITTAASVHGVAGTVLARWLDGYIGWKNGKKYPSKEGCYRVGVKKISVQRM